MAGITPAKQLYTVLVLLYLGLATLAIDPEDPDSVAPATISVCGSDATAALFSSSQRIRTLLANSWGLGLSRSDFTSSLTGIELFLNGTCDVLVTAIPLSESQAAPLVRGLNRTIMEVPFAVLSRKIVHSWQPWSAEGRELHMTPDVLADIFQCNIIYLDDPRIQASNPDLRLAHVPITPMDDWGGARTSMLTRTFAALVPNWRLGAHPTPMCVGSLNVTYADFQNTKSFYIGPEDPRFNFGNPPSVVLDLVSNKAEASAPAPKAHQGLPTSTSISAWLTDSFILDRTDSKPVQELRSLDFLMFLVFDHDSISRGYPIGCQIRQLGEALLSDGIQSQLPAYGLKPLSSLNLPSATVQGYRGDVASVLCKSTPDMPNYLLRSEGIPEQLAVAGSGSFSALMADAVKKFGRAAVGWEPAPERITSAVLYKYPKRTVDLVILDDAIEADVLMAKSRVGAGLIQIPFALDAGIIAHSIPGVAQDSLCLDAETVADILQCSISTWNHPNITALNPSARLPDQVINVRVDPLNFALVHTVAKYLDELAPGWKLGKDHTVQWPPCVNLVLGTTNQSSVFETEHVLGFQQLSKSDEQGLGRAIRVKNRAGAFVSPHNISAASLHTLNISSIAPEQWENFTTASSNAPEMYPLGMMGFLVWDINSTDIGYEEGRRLKNITTWLLSNAVQNSLPHFGLVPTYQNASALIRETIVQTTPDVERSQPEGVPVNDLVTCCSTSVAYSSFAAMFWQIQERTQGRPFLLDTTWPSETEALNAFLSGKAKQDCAIMWSPVPTQDILSAPRQVMQIPIGFAPLPVIHNFEGIPNNQLRLDAHALAGLYSCKIRSFNGYIQALNPDLTLPPGNITVVATPRSHSASKHLVNYIRQDAMWDADMDAAPGWPACILQTCNRPHSVHVSQLMLENPNSMIGFQPIGNFLAVQILTERARVANQTGDSRDLHNPTSDVEERVLRSIWKDSALPVERGVLVRNAVGDYMAATPVLDVNFPFDNQTLPDSFQSPAWGALQDPTNDMAPNAYPIGQLMFVVIDEDIGAKGRVHAKRMKSFLRYLVTENIGLDVPVLAGESLTGAQGQRDMLEYYSVKALPQKLEAWALQGIKQLPYDPLPPLPSATMQSGIQVRSLTNMKPRAHAYVETHVAVALALGVAVTLGVIAVGLLIWRREHQIRHNSFRGACSLKMQRSSSVSSGAVDLKLELDGKGEPVLLGQGSFAKVYKGRWNGVLVAVKALNAPAAEVMEDFQRECAILERLRHPNIIKYFGTATSAEGHVMMVTEYMQGGDLGTALVHDSPSPRRLGWYQNGHLIALDIARGLAYLHAQKVISFDVKPANVLLDRMGKHAKLADVGLAKVLEHSQTMTNMRGTLDYMPPEMFGSYDEEGEGPGKQPITQAADVYSFGLVLWQIITSGCLDKTQGSLRAPRIPEECPAQIAQLYTACLSQAPEQRPKAADLVRIILGTLNGSMTASAFLGGHSGTGISPAKLFPSFKGHRK